MAKKGRVAGAAGGAVSGALIGSYFGPIGALVGAAIGAGIGYAIGNWIDHFTIPQPPEQRPDKGGWDGGRWAPNDQAIPVVYGCPEVPGVVVYSGGGHETLGTNGATEYVNPSTAVTLCIAWGEGPVAGICGLTLDDVPVDDIDGAHYRHYLGTPTQEADPRFVTVTRRVELPTAEWYEWDPNDPSYVPPAKTIAFSPAEDGATAWLHVQMQAALEGEDRNKQTSLQLEYRADGEVSWTDAGVYVVTVPEGQMGMVDAYLPVGDPTGTAPHLLYTEYTLEQTLMGPDGNGHYLVQSTMVATPHYLNRVTGVAQRAFAGGVAHQVRVSAYGGTPITGPGAASWVVRFPAVEVQERLGAQAMRRTAYTALTVPLKALAASQPTCRARVLGRPVAVVDETLGAVTRWTNNPVWCARDLLENTRYGAALPGVVRLGATLTEWGGARAAAALCDEVLGELDAGTLSERRWEVPGGFIAEGLAASAVLRVLYWTEGSGTLTLYRGGVAQACTATYQGQHDGRLQLSAVSAPSFAFAAGDDWRATASPALRWVTDGAPLVSYAVAGLTDETRDYSGYVALSGPTVYVRRLAWHDRGRGRVLLADDFAAMAPNTLSIREPRFRYDGALATARDAVDAAREILTHCRALLWEDAGELHLGIETAVPTPAGYIDALGQTAPGGAGHGVDFGPVVEGSIEIWEEREDDRPDALLCRYVDPDQGYENREVLVGSPVSGGHTETREWPGCMNPRQAQRLGTYALEIAQLPGRVRLATPLSSIALEPGDVVRLYLPEGGSAYGYDVADPDAPAITWGSGALLRVWQVSDDPQADVRSYLFREYAAAAYDESLQPNLPRNVRDSGRHSAPRPAADLVFTFLGDLTDDGVWNPEVVLEWTQPFRGTVAAWEVYESRDGGAVWNLIGRTSLPRLRWRVAGFVGTLQARVIPLGIAGLLGSWSASACGTVAIHDDVTAPATPTGLRGTYDAAGAWWHWDRNVEPDFSHYLVSMDAGGLWQRVNGSSVGKPPEECTERSYTLRVAAVDRTGNISDPTADVTASLPAPPAPSLAYLSDVVNRDKAYLLVGAGAPQSRGHVGWLFQWRVEGGPWANVSDQVGPFAVWDLSMSGGAVGITGEWRYAEVDVIGVGAWSEAVTGVTITPLGALADLDLVDTEYVAPEAVTEVVTVSSPTQLYLDSGWPAAQYDGVQAALPVQVTPRADAIGVLIELYGVVSAQTGSSPITATLTVATTHTSHVRAYGAISTLVSVWLSDTNADFAAAGVAIGDRVWIALSYGWVDVGFVAESVSSTEVRVSSGGVVAGAGTSYLIGVGNSAQAPGTVLNQAQIPLTTTPTPWTAMGGPVAPYRATDDLWLVGVSYEYTNPSPGYVLFNLQQRYARLLFLKR